MCLYSHKLTALDMENIKMRPCPQNSVRQQLGRLEQRHWPLGSLKSLAVKCFPIKNEKQWTTALLCTSKAEESRDQNHP